MLTEMQNSNIMPNIYPKLQIESKFNKLLGEVETVDRLLETVDRLQNIPTDIPEIEGRSPPLSKDELLYIMDNISDLMNGNYYSSKPNEKIDDFLKKLLE